MKFVSDSKPAFQEILAMKYGKPAIVSEGTVMSRIVEEFECGVVVPYGDSRKLAEALDGLKDEDRYRRMCENAFRAHCERYNWETVATRIVGVYRGLVGILGEQVK